ncbi:OsmC family protein [Bacillus badius]|uniref:OsmC family protein n=1 Tax=Bacillus badius TaxID=1455 RepID=A0ABR5B0G4_BACBA|nr:OsmC family protein [Bacillus badius]KIL75005.1 OsmC family protein [Bacillus badius]KIL80013.1 OsmC family protein [Bacillus badius]MED4717950.1 OsmC family protein [Bacillus badius]
MNQISLAAAQQTASAIKENPALKIRSWQAQIQWQTGVQNKVTIRDFDPILTDEPETLGGTDQAPNPVEYLIGAAGSCFAITFEVMASEKGIPLKSVDVEIKADLNAAVFLGMEEGDGGILNPVITLRADAEAPKEELKEIAQAALAKSPVLSSLKKDIQLIIQ